MRHLLCLVLGGLLLVSAPDAAAQTFTGALRGEVRDPGGIIPGVTVMLINQETGIERETLTNEVGQYNFPAVVPGLYTVRASLPGFRTSEQTGVRVATQQVVTLDITLEVGAIEEAITVTAEVPLIETSTASTGDVLDRRALETLPSRGRNAFLIGVTVPTVVTTGDRQWDRQQDQTNASLVSLGGGTRRGNNYLIDGFPVTDLTNRSIVNPTIEALDEVGVQLHTFDAEMGRTGGGTFNVTSRSGTNIFRGTGMYQTRPRALENQNFFTKAAGLPKPDTKYHLYAGGVGGPIVRNRTFFWWAGEGYRSTTTRNGNLIFPTSRQRQGDFSQTFDSNGNLVVIRDPMTGQPFPDNVIPADRLSTVGRNMANLMPTPDRDVADGQPNYIRTAEIVDAADMITTKIDHRFGDRVSLSGLYMYNKTDEPFEVYWEQNLFQDPSSSPLRRRIHGIVLNNTYIVNPTTVATLRYGWTQFRDDVLEVEPFDVGTLGFNPAFVNAMEHSKFPDMNIDDLGRIGNNNFGNTPDILRRYYSWGFNGTLSRLMGRHTVKVGADFRRIGVELDRFGNPSGNFTFRNAHFTGNALANLLMGFPSTGSVDLAVKNDFFVNYYSAYIQDDFRVNSRLTLNYGLRFEHESGVRDSDDRMTVGFDRDAINPINNLVNIPGRDAIRGGLLYAGQDGAQRHHGDPASVKVGPRVGAVWAFDDKTVFRGGYGIFWAPWNYPGPTTTNYGQIGYSAVTTMVQDTVTPITSLDDPFPDGLVQPSGNSLGMLTGLGGNVQTVDQFKQDPRVQQISVELQRELPGQFAASIGYMGARGDDLGLGGTVLTLLNINQIRPEAAAGLTPAQLLERVPNPFFGVAEAGPISGIETIERGQLLRPFPQYRNVNLAGVTEGYNRYHAVVLRLNKRVGADGWGGRFHYTWSRLEDNQFGETNHYAQRPGNPQNAYDLEAEFGNGLLDVPHRLVLSPIVELPFGQGRRFMTGGGIADVLLGGWSFSAVGSIQSGFPAAIGYNTGFTQNHLGLFGTQNLRPNLTGTDPQAATTIAAPTTTWVNRDAYAAPPVGQFGTAPRTDTRVRTPTLKNLDLVFNKEVRIGGPQRAEVRFEVLNVLNNLAVTGFPVALDTGTFGVVGTQSGFMRIVQLTFRYRF